MNDELNALQEAAMQARANADELKTALTDESSDEERATADQAEQAAASAESAFTTAKAQADAAEAAHSGGGAGVKDGEDRANRSAFAPAGARAGDACTCPDGRPGTVAVFADNLAICLPNQG